MTDCSIIIVNYNTAQLTANCLKSVYDNLPSKYIFEVIVVDNASTDGSVDALKKQFPQCKLIANKQNLGFSKANNIAIKQSLGAYVLLLNSDTIVLPDALGISLAYAQAHPEAGIVGCKLFYQDMTFQRSAAMLPTIKNMFFDYIFNKSYGHYKLAQFEKSGPVGCVIGAFMLASKATIDKIGLLNEKYFMNSEDVDWCFKTWKCGLEVHYCADAHVIHIYGQSSLPRKEKIQWELYKNVIKYFYLNHGILQAIAASLITVGLFVKTFFKNILKRIIRK